MRAQISRLIPAFAFLLMSASVVASEYAVIVHPSSSSEITQKDVAKIFLAKSKKLPDGTPSTPVSQKDNSDARAAFENNILQKSPSQIKAYWSQLVFTGKAVPIEELEGDSAVVAKVASTPGAIGFIDAASATPDVKVALTF